jgi:hypothetical protein
MRHENGTSYERRDQILVIAPGESSSETRYHNSIPGDSPKLMPLDEPLNMDIHSSARYHVMITAHLAKENEKQSLFQPQERSPTRTSALWTLFPVTHPLLNE